MNKLVDMRISKVKIFGEDVNPVSVVFKSGLNLVSGPSNTGKSHLFEMIDSLLGKNKLPEEIKQEKVYSQSVIEISLGNSIHSFIRDLTSNKSYYQNGEVNELLNLNMMEHLADKHNSYKSKKLGISNHLMNLMNCPYQKIRSNNNGKLTSFTFRYFSHLCMIGESNIFSNNTYFLSNQPNTQLTSNKEAFLTTLSGIDDSSLLVDDSLVSSFEKLAGQISEIERQINLNTQVLQRISNSEKENIKKIDSEINNCKVKIRNYTSRITSLENKRNNVYENLKEINRKLNYSLEILNRIHLLKENYESDLKRIDFVDQSNYYFEQLESFPCPICGEDTTELSNDISNLVKLEQANLESKLLGLDMALNDAKSDVQNRKTDKESLEIEIVSLNNAIEKEIQPVLSKIITEYEILMEKKNEHSSKQFLEKQNTNLSSRLEELDKQKLEQKNKNLNTSSKTEIIDFEELATFVNSLLEEWGLFENVKVEFDPKTYDLIINGNKKGSFGKGYRALLNSAYAIANFLYAQKNDLSYPGFMVIDSPLVAFSPKIEDENDISEKVKDLFYKSLAKRFVGSQIIILENQTPDDKNFTMFNHIQFTRNPNFGRYGLYPRLVDKTE